MGASYSCIITKERINIPTTLPHFYKRDALTIPVDCNSWAVDSFLELFDQGRLATTDEEVEELKKYEFGNDTKDPRSILYILNKTGLTYKRFMVLYYSEWADIPEDLFYAVFDKGYMVKETKMTVNEGVGSIDAFEYLGIKWEDVYKEDYFYLAREEYLKLLDKQ